MVEAGVLAGLGHGPRLEPLGLAPDLHLPLGVEPAPGLEDLPHRPLPAGVVGHAEHVGGHAQGAADLHVDGLGQQRAGVDQAQVAVEPGDEGRRVLDQRAVPLLAGLQLELLAMALGDVLDVRDGVAEPAVAAAHGRDVQPHPDELLVGEHHPELERLLLGAAQHHLGVRAGEAADVVGVHQVGGRFTQQLVLGALHQPAVRLVDLDVAAVGAAQHHAQRCAGERQAEAMLGIAAGQGLGDDAGRRGEHRDVVVAPDALALDQVEPDEADEATLVGERHGQHRARPTRLEALDLLPPPRVEVCHPRDVDDLEALERGHPGRERVAWHGSQVVDLGGDAGRGPLVGVLDQGAVVVGDEHVGAVDRDERADVGQRGGDAAVDLVGRPMDERRGHPREQVLERQPLAQRVERVAPVACASRSTTAVVPRASSAGPAPTKRSTSRQPPSPWRTRTRAPSSGWLSPLDIRLSTSSWCSGWARSTRREPMTLSGSTSSSSRRAGLA